MKKKANTFLFFSILIGIYVIYAIVSVFNNWEKYKSITDFIVVFIMLGLVIILEIFLLNKFKYYSNTEGLKQENNQKEKIEEIKRITDNTNIKPISNRGCLVPIILFFVICIMVIFNIANTEFMSSNVNKIMKVGIEDKEKANQIDEILKECGVNIQDIIHEELLDNATGANEKGYRITSDGIKNIILYLREDNTVYSIKYANNFLYNNNTVMSNLSDYYLTDKEKSKLEINSEEMVRSMLKSPSTAKFPNILEWKFYRYKDKIVVQSYVDSQNSFGAMIRSEFQITLEPDKTTVTSFIFDGQEYINK